MTKTPGTQDQDPQPPRTVAAWVASVVAVPKRASRATARARCLAVAVASERFPMPHDPDDNDEIADEAVALLGR